MDLPHEGIDFEKGHFLMESRFLKCISINVTCITHFSLLN